MLVVNAETIIQLEADPQTVINTLVVTAVHIFQAVAHKVRLNRFNGILIDREFIARKIFNPPGVAGEVIMDIGFFGSEEVLIPAAAEGESPVIRGPAQRGTDEAGIRCLRTDRSRKDRHRQRFSYISAYYGNDKSHRNRR